MRPLTLQPHGQLVEGCNTITLNRVKYYSFRDGRSRVLYEKYLYVHSYTPRAEYNLVLMPISYGINNVYPEMRYE